MEITVHTRHLDIPDQLRESAVEKAQHLERFMEGTQLAEVIFSRDHAARDDGLCDLRGPRRCPWPFGTRPGGRAPGERRSRGGDEQGGGAADTNAGPTRAPLAAPPRPGGRASDGAVGLNLAQSPQEGPFLPDPAKADLASPRVVIVGATGTGKTALALEMARRGTGTLRAGVRGRHGRLPRSWTSAPPSRHRPSRRGAPWHLIDIVDPSEQFSVAAFQSEAGRALAGIEARGHVPLLVGGTGLYHRAVVDALAIPGRFPDLAAELEHEADAEGGLAESFRRLWGLDPVAAQRIEPANRRRIVRALEVTIGTGRPFSSFGPGLVAYGPTSSIIIGLELERPELDRRLAKRFDDQLARGFLEEVRALASRPAGLSRTARQAIGYRELLSHIEQGVPLEQAKAEVLRRLRALARRQEAWFKRDPRVVWIRADRSDLLEAVACRPR